MAECKGLFGRGPLLGVDSDGVSVDDELASLDLHITMETAVGGVILEHVGLSDRR